MMVESPEVRPAEMLVLLANSTDVHVSTELADRQDKRTYTAVKIVLFCMAELFVVVWPPVSTELLSAPRSREDR